MVETTTTPTKEAKEGQEMSLGQQTGELDREEDHVDPSTTSTQINRLHDPEKTTPKNKGKATKTSVDPITLTEGDLLDIRKTIWEVAEGALQGLRMEQNTVLGALSVQIQGL